MNRIISVFVLVLLTTAFWPAFAESDIKVPKGLRVGIVDGEKLFDEYPEAQEATKKISNAQEDLKNQITESEKVFTEFSKEKKSEAEKLTKQKELQSKIDAKAQETRKMIESLSSKIENDIVNAIKTIAGEKGIEVVLDKRAVLYGGSDITDTVSEYLKKKSPLIGGNTMKTETKKTSKKSD